MAYRKFPLPALKLTQRSTSAPKAVRIVHRSMESSLQLPDRDYSGAVPSDPPSGPEAEASSDASLLFEPEEPMEHELFRRSSIAGWEGIRQKLRASVTEGAAMPLGKKCVMCEEEACFRCQQCGSLGFYCSFCFTKLHSQVNILHIAEKWEVRK